MTAAFRLFAALLLALALAGPAAAALRVTPEGSNAFLLVPVDTGEGGPWYDALDWLGRVPGVVTAEAEPLRLTHRRAGRTAVLSAAPPYALRDGLALGEAPAPRVVEGRLAVTEGFLLARASDFLGLPVAVEKVHGTGALRVVLDPGHGGADRGSQAPGAPPEKEAVLLLARQVAESLRKRGIEPRLTREDDRDLSGLERAAAANRSEGDLFLSLHASGAERPQGRGFEVFVAAPAAPDPRLWAGGQAGREAESRRWAEAVRAAMGQVAATFDRGIRALPSPVLEAVAAPACLLEVGNLSWPEDAQALAAPKARLALAEALANAAEAYFRGPAGGP